MSLSEASRTAALQKPQCTCAFSTSLATGSGRNASASVTELEVTKVVGDEFCQCRATDHQVLGRMLKAPRVLRELEGAASDVGGVATAHQFVGPTVCTQETFYTSQEFFLEE